MDSQPTKYKNAQKTKAPIDSSASFILKFV